MMEIKIIKKLLFLLLVALIAVATITSCSSNEEKEEKCFAFLGDGYENGVFRPENFDKDTIVTPENIDSLYNQYNVYTLFNGDYYLIRSKMSYTTSRYLSRLIQMKEGKQVAAKTFYDSEIDVNKVIKLRDKLIIGLNSLRINNYDSTFHQSSHQCRVVALSDSLTPIVGKRFNSQNGHTYIETLMQISDSTFICSVASGEVEISPYSHYQFKAHKDLNIVGKTVSSNQYQYEIRIEDLDFSKPDWGNDLSDNYLRTLKKNAVENKSAIPNDSVQSPIPSNNPQKPSIPKDFVLVPKGTLKNREWNIEKQRDEYYTYTIDSFYICKYELTQGEYKRVVGNINKNNYVYAMDDYVDGNVKFIKNDKLPVIGSYLDFVTYCNKRSAAEGFDGFYEIKDGKVSFKTKGNGYRLLFSLEWTYAAKGGQKNEEYRFVGGNSLKDVAWYGGNSGNKPHVVGQKKANSIGLYDMAGNISEMLESKSGKYNKEVVDDYHNWVIYDGNMCFSPYNISYYSIKNRMTGTRIAFVPKGMKSNQDIRPRCDY